MTNRLKMDYDQGVMGFTLPHINPMARGQLTSNKFMHVLGKPYLLESEFFGKSIEIKGGLLSIPMVFGSMYCGKFVLHYSVCWKKQRERGEVTMDPKVGSFIGILHVKRNLVKLHLQDSEVEDQGGDWLSCFPESCTALECLNFSCVDSEINFEALERLLARCPCLKSLQLNRKISLDQLQRLLVKAPQLIDLGTGTYNQDLRRAQAANLRATLLNCKSLRTLSGLWGIEPEYIPMLYPVCRNLTSLNLSYAPIQSFQFVKLIRHCPKLQRLSLQDSVEDKGLRAVGSSCKNLEELHVFPVDPNGQVYCTEEGLIAIASGCSKLTNILYFCRQMTNAAIIKMSTACPELTRFRLCIVTPLTPDHTTGQPFDEGFGAIVKNCNKLRRLAVSGKLTDKAFAYIGHYGKKVETLSVAFAGDSDLGLEYVLNGCKSLRKLEIRNCPFGDTALVSGLHQYESMRFLWMSSCRITLIGCYCLAKRQPRLNVEVIKEDENRDNVHIEKLYVYRSLAGNRADLPLFVHAL